MHQVWTLLVRKMRGAVTLFALMVPGDDPLAAEQSFPAPAGAVSGEWPDDAAALSGPEPPGVIKTTGSDRFWHRDPMEQLDPLPPFQPTVNIHGVFQADRGFFKQDPTNRLLVGNAVDGADFRRARLSAQGSVTETVNYFLQMDFAFFWTSHVYRRVARTDAIACGGKRAHWAMETAL
ncbi:MAG: hypothetical protein KatS3mg110_2362 [Pirellulaceae bacterium]|nr:MAG: hypothetical protein KatS3mg110_2362 [Pirellulaceae bacterium]